MNTRGGGKQVIPPLRTRSKNPDDEQRVSPAGGADRPLSNPAWSKLLLDPASDSVQLKVQGLASPLPSISDVETIFLDWCRNRIWRIEIRESKAIVDVHPDDAASCISGVSAINGRQVWNTR